MGEIRIDGGGGRHIYIYIYIGGEIIVSGKLFVNKKQQILEFMSNFYAAVSIIIVNAAIIIYLDSCS